MKKLLLVLFLLATSLMLVGCDVVVLGEYVPGYDAVIGYPEYYYDNCRGNDHRVDVGVDIDYGGWGYY
jgi:hypothetical protein